MKTQYTKGSPVNLWKSSNGSVVKSGMMEDGGEELLKLVSTIVTTCVATTVTACVATTITTCVATTVKHVLQQCYNMCCNMRHRICE
jgi:hypothetical protein